MLDKGALKDRLLGLPSKIESTLKALADIPGDLDGKLYTLTDPGHLRIDIPWGTYKKVRSQLGSVWQATGSGLYGRQDDTGDRYYYLQHKETGITLTICQDSEGELAPSCRRIQVGTKEVPVYEVVCDELEDFTEQQYISKS